MAERCTSFHIAISCDIDSYSDGKLRTDYLPFFVQLGCQTPSDIRRKCIQARAKGYTVFPPCQNIQADGSCAGHSDEDLGLGHVPDLKQEGGAHG